MSLFKKKPKVDYDAIALQQELAILDAVLENYAHGHRLSFGSPSRCPRCTSFGFIASVNDQLGVTYNTCLSCNVDWVITRRALKALAAAPTVPTPVSRSGLLS